MGGFDRLPQKEDKFLPQLTPLIRVLVGLQELTAKRPATDVTFFDTSLNRSQQSAVRFALQSPEVACIHGPPGSLGFLSSEI